MTLAGAGAAVLAGCGGAGTKSGRQAVKHVARPIQRADVAILGRMLALERRTVAAYTAGIPLLAKPDVKAAEQFLNEELLHAGELLSLIKAAGGHAPPHAASYDLGHPNDAGEVLALLHGLERALIAAYLTAIPRLSPGPVRAAVASILANDAQHISILRLFTGSSPVPSAFVTGDE
jgi:hypothetical protein